MYNTITHFKYSALKKEVFTLFVLCSFQLQLKLECAGGSSKHLPSVGYLEKTITRQVYILQVCYLKSVFILTIFLPFCCTVIFILIVLVFTSVTEVIFFRIPLILKNTVLMYM